jgi:hypothetical protein
MVTFSTVYVLVGIYTVWLHLRWIRPFESVRRGTTEAQIIAVLGKPSDITHENDTLTETWETKDGFGTAGGTSVQVYHYVTPPFAGGEYCITFDSNGRAIAKADLVSP